MLQFRRDQRNRKGRKFTEPPHPSSSSPGPSIVGATLAVALVLVVAPLLAPVLIFALVLVLALALVLAPDLIFAVALAHTFGLVGLGPCPAIFNAKGVAQPQS